MLQAPFAWQPRVPKPPKPSSAALASKQQKPDSQQAPGLISSTTTTALASKKQRPWDKQAACSSKGAKATVHSTKVRASSPSTSPTASGFSTAPKAEGTDADNAAVEPQQLLKHQPYPDINTVLASAAALMAPVPAASGHAATAGEVTTDGLHGAGAPSSDADAIGALMQQWQPAAGDMLERMDVEEGDAVLVVAAGQRRSRKPHKRVQMRQQHIQQLQQQGHAVLSVPSYYQQQQQVQQQAGEEVMQLGQIR